MVSRSERRRTKARAVKVPEALLDRLRGLIPLLDEEEIPYGRRCTSIQRAASIMLLRAMETHKLARLATDAMHRDDDDAHRWGV